jgi:nitroimidazol reductase NimA-like FMN-containing flavoprotein (pyridoxamine 5'-phosphate oxidase superfamily)
MDDGLELLTEAECRSLLASGSIGRVGVTVGALPVILPVNYAYVDGAIVFRTAEGTKLRAAVDRAVIAFEVDEYDEALQHGWSVLAVGQASEVADEAELATFRALGLAPWADGTRTHYVRLVPEMLTGRRIVAV